MNKKRKYAYAAMTSACLVIAVIVVLNIIVVSLSDKMNINIDLTKDSILSFSSQTKEIIKNTDTDVEIISLVPQDDNRTELIHVEEILKKYALMSDHIEYKRVDTKKMPFYLTNYEYNGKPLNEYDNAANYHIIFETENNYEVISLNDVIETKEKLNYTEDGIEYYLELTGRLYAEPHFTSALLKVTKGSDINVYVVSGHGELYKAEDFLDILLTSSYNFKDISLATEEIPEDADLIVVVSPSNDYSEREISKLEAFMNKGGDLQVIVDYSKPSLPNLFTLLDEWGIVVEDGLVCDDNTNNYIDSRAVLLPVIPDNEVTREILKYPGLSNAQFSFPSSRPIVAKDKHDVSSFTVASTSEDGYIKRNTQTITSDVFVKGDERRVSQIAAMNVRYNSSNDSYTRIFVAGTSAFISYNNPNLYCSIIDIQTDSENTVVIAPKNIGQSEVIISKSTVYLYAFLVMAVIPVIILTAGFIIWVRRRHL